MALRRSQTMNDILTVPVLHHLCALRWKIATRAYVSFIARTEVTEHYRFWPSRK